MTKPGLEHAELKNFEGDRTVLMTGNDRQIGEGAAKASTIVGERLLVLDGDLGTGKKTITTIYVDNRTEPEKFIPAFQYHFNRQK